MKKLVVCLIGIAAVLQAQSDRGRLTGIVYDPSGAVVAHATVAADNSQTSAKREAVTDAMGHYLIDGLLPASDRVTISVAGFADLAVANVVLGAGEERTIDLHLKPAAVQNAITVDGGDATQAQTETASIASTVGSREVDNLPINGRMVSNLYLLVPGSSVSSSGTFDDIRFFGRSNEQNTIRYDGIEAGAIIDSSPADLTGANGASQFRLSQSLENIQEFHVESTTYSAEYGRGTGGQVTIITKSGSNQLHGDLFEYLRNDWFDARNYFDRGAKQAPLRLNQFGGSVGGAILKNKLFFFASQENLMQRVYVNFTENTLSDFARSQAVPSIRPALAAFPVGQIHTSSPYFDIVSGAQSSYVNEYFGNARFDYRINDRNTMYVRYSRDQGDAVIPTDIGGSGTANYTVPQNGIADLTSILRPTLINDFKFGVNSVKNRYTIQGYSGQGIDLSNVTINIGGAAQSGATGIVKPTGAGSAPLIHSNPYTNYEFEIIDNLTWTHGTHTVKTGVEFTPRRMYVDETGGSVYTYTNVQNFLANIPSQVQIDGDLDESPSPFHNGYLGTRLGTQYFWGAFVQDEWRIHPGLTMNYGLRYDYFSPLKEAHDLLVNVDTLTGQTTPGNADPYHSIKTNFGPRLAFAWAPPSLHNSTVFRIGAGYYYGPGQSEDTVQPILNDIANVTLTTGDIAYPVSRPSLLAAFNPNDPNASWQPRALGNGYQVPENVLSYTASIEQTLPDHSVFTVAYIGSQGRNLFQRTIANLITGVTMNPSSGVGIIQRQFGNRLAELDVKTAGGSSTYNALNLNWNRRLSHGLTAAASYTWSHSYGTSAGSNEATTAENNFSFAQERGNNSSDERHVLNLYALWELPIGRGKPINFGDNRLVNTLFGNWQLGGDYNYHSGLPINVTMSRNNILYFDQQDGRYYTNPVKSSSGQILTVPVINILGGGQSRGTQRPDLVPGVDPYVNTGSGFFLNPAAFAVPAPGTFGNLGRDALVGPQFSQFDTTLSKQFTLTERARFELRADFYNLLNHPNLKNPPSVLGGALPSGPTASGQEPGQALTRSNAGTSFGFLNSTVGTLVNLGTSRQIQVAARLTF